jgi:hypothetical protein
VSSPAESVTSAGVRTKAVVGRDVAVLGGTLLLWFVVTALAARSVGLSPWPTATWGRWDTGLYLSIADKGYEFVPCVGVANRGPGDFCGNSGWFPGYPYLMRLGSWFGPNLDTAGRLISFVAMLVAWSALWFGFLRRRAFVAGMLGMAVAAVFPSSVYYGAIFPISTMLAAVMLALVCLDRQRWLLAGLCGAVAAVVYPSGVLIGSIAIVPFTTLAIGDVRARVRATVAVAAPVALAYMAVLANFQRAVGAWDAWYKTSASYNLEPTFPLEMIRRQVEKMGNDAQPGIIGVQTLLIAAMVLAAVWIVVTQHHELTLGERGAAVLCVFLWLIPLTLGGDLSLYRAESLLLPIVILLSRLRMPVVAMLAVVCVPVAYKMAQLFFDATLI